MTFLLGALLLVSDPSLARQSAAQPVQPAQAAPKKKQQVCEYLELTGSRSRRRVCRDANGDLDLGPGVSHSAYGKGIGSDGGHAGTSPPPQ